MSRLRSLTRRFIQEQDGAVVTEYGMLIVIVVLAMSAVLILFKDKVSTWFSSIGDNLQNIDGSSAAPAP